MKNSLMDVKHRAMGKLSVKTFPEALTFNSPYANRWSKTMVGYGPEANHFVVELTYNYGVKSYELGNDFRGITIRSSEVLQRAKSKNWPILPGNVLEAPGGYKFHIIDSPQPTERGKFTRNVKCVNIFVDVWF